MYKFDILNKNFVIKIDLSYDLKEMNQIKEILPD